MTKEGIEDGGTQSLHLSQDPFLTEGVTLDSASETSPVSVTLKGCHLDNLADVEFGSSSSKSGPLPASSQKAESAEVKFTGTSALKTWDTDLKAGKTISLGIWLISTTDPSNPKDSKQTLTATPPTKPAPKK